MWIIATNIATRGYSIKKQEGWGRKFSVTPSDKIGIISTPGQKRVFSLHPSDTKQDLLPPSDMFFSCDPPRQFCPILPPSDSLSWRFYPPRTFFLSILPPADSFFHPIYPPRTVYFDNFTPLDIFLKVLPPSDTFSWEPPWTKNCIPSIL